MQRAEGRAEVGFKAAGERTVLADLFQSGCCKVRLPRLPTRHAEAVLINTSGGLTDGDRIEQRIDWQAGANAVVTTQACERIYRSRERSAEIRNRLSLADRAFGLWLPQETILFDGGRLRREAVAHLEGSARLLSIEAVIAGRSAMGETVRSGEIRDGWRIYRDGELIFADCTGLEGDIAAKIGRWNRRSGCRAFASIIYAGEDSSAKCAAIRPFTGPATSDAATMSGCTDLGGIMLARLIAPDGLALRRQLVRCLAALAGRTYLPRVWST
ncbi:urease accessory protein UreD [Stappia sp. F7233]|uniref:Urease accessory protein UreD n=1 Tax=Stappia albiluteola TaxID=2758565 RepID=A0A839ADT6_9HYPH|nr:urease accessory protein UreD [Stappia albiluteola]MBA5777072.1 urease accessory protein UreD [Stappia albiluteola]